MYYNKEIDMLIRFRYTNKTFVEKYYFYRNASLGPDSLASCTCIELHFKFVCELFIIIVIIIIIIINLFIPWEPSEETNEIYGRMYVMHVLCIYLFNATHTRARMY